MRKPAASVRLSSVPRCLRHVSPGIALEEAGALAVFLQGVTTTRHEDGFLPSADYSWGLPSVSTCCGTRSPLHPAN